MLHRRQFLASASAAALGLGFRPDSLRAAPHDSVPHDVSAPQHSSVLVLNPALRTPVSFIIDDSTTLVNMGHFCMPQFQAAWGGKNYDKPWKTWPREIPDAFVREFGEWCAEQGVKGKYSVVPYPACVGYVDRELPGWSRSELRASLKLVRDLLLPDWDIHPEMITHTRVIDLKTGRPLEPVTSATMENSFPQEEKSVDELTSYLAHALRLLKNVDLPCAGVTTPGGFGNRVKPELSLAVHQAVRDVFQTPLPHYFKYVVGSRDSTEPRVEHVSGLGTDDVRATVNVVAGTGDWFGGWDGSRTPEPDRYANADASAGRVVEMLTKREPAVFLCHWPGLFCNGSKAGLRAFQQVVTRINERFANELRWMKVSEIAAYWGAKRLTTITRDATQVTLSAPFPASDFTLKIENLKAPSVTRNGKRLELRQAQRATDLTSGCWMQEDGAVVLCIDLEVGETVIEAPPTP